MGVIEETIRIYGADAVRQALDRVAEAEKGVGQAAETAGKESRAAGEELGGFGAILATVGKQAQGMVTGFLGLGALLSVFQEIGAELERIVELQGQLSEGAVDLAGESKLLARQLGVDEIEGMRVLTTLRKAGGMRPDVARQFGIMAEVALANQGGLMKNLPLAEQIAGFAGAKGMDAAAAEQLMGFLRMAGKLGSEPEAKTAVAKIAAAATASNAESVGAFIRLLAGGGTGLLQAGVPLTDLLTMAGQTRYAEVNEDLAKQTLLTLELTATGAEKQFTSEIESRARAAGLDIKGLTTVQRVGLTRDILGGVTTQAEEDRIRKMMSADRGQRLLKAFRASTVKEMANLPVAVEAAGETDFDKMVEQGRGEMTFRKEAAQAEEDLANALVGAKHFSISEFRKGAHAELNRRRALREVPWLVELLNTDKGLERKLQWAAMRRQLFVLRNAGEITPEEELAVYEEVLLDRRSPLIPMPKSLTDYNLDRAWRKISDFSKGAGVPFTFNVTNIGTNYALEKPGYHNEPQQDMGGHRD